jgi:hypothetical protein
MKIAMRLLDAVHFRCLNTRAAAVRFVEWIYLTKSASDTFSASANLSSIFSRGLLVFLRNCHADFRAVLPEYPIR